MTVLVGLLLATNGAMVAPLALGAGDARAAAEDTDPDTEVARRLFAEGGAFYEKGDYQSALQAFQKARFAKALPAFDYNIARCLDRLGRWEEALSAYQRFVDSARDPAEKDEVNGRIRVLRERVAAMRAAEQASPVPSIHPAPPRAPAPAVTVAPPLPPAPSVQPVRAGAESTPTVEAPAAMPAADPAAREEPGAPPLYRRWWLWTIVGAVAAGAGVGLALGLTRSGPAAPACADCGDGTLRF